MFGCCVALAGLGKYTQDTATTPRDEILTETYSGTCPLGDSDPGLLADITADHPDRVPEHRLPEVLPPWARTAPLPRNEESTSETFHTASDGKTSKTI
ncbi:hypothetical protein TRICI_004854 [Trichomonascus ciferrii]|uniref:Uncharacterized protein n=1 Tax=Trichomonascus ciferrii TaxID=44093 RepID=A0A642UZ01_9ASCO|nr:hypothetical protein TRICI_004854 [Trichomonascus ciferrii]